MSPLSSRRTSRTRPALAALLAAGLLALSACSGSDGSGDADQTAAQPADSPTSASTADAEEAAQTGHAGHAGHYAEPAKSRRLRAGETRTTIAMPGAYTPSAPYGTGTDDYRCFLLDPELDQDTWLTGTQVLPGNPDVVHHVILFQVPPKQVQPSSSSAASLASAAATCRGGTWNRITWCTTSGLPGSTCVPVSQVSWSSSGSSRKHR